MPDLIDLENRSSNLNQEWFIELIKEFKDCLKSPNFAKEIIELGDGLQGSLFFKSGNDRGPGDDLYLFEKYNEKNRSSIIPIFNGEKNSNRVGYTNNMYSINGRSTRKESAWKFLSFLLEENIQAYTWMPGTSTNIAGEDKYIKVNEKEMINQNKEIARRFHKERREVYGKIDYLYEMDYFNQDIMYPIMEYLEDKITIEEAIKKAQENVDLRLNE
jgi:ABC-type glycerol-3-phosphate transport system substrate-binding protein